MHHSFDIVSAGKYGVIEAILYENILHWLRVNKANGANIQDGKVWTYNSVQAYSKLFPYLTTKQIRRAIESLVEQKAIVKGDYNKANYDKTSWYSIPDESILSICPEGQAISPKGQMDVPAKADRSAQTGEPIPDINHIHKPYVNTDTPPGLDRLSEHIEQYSKKVCRVDRIALDYKINQASAKVSIETLEQCLQGVLQAADDPTYPADKLPRSLSALLGDVERIDSWARRYTAKQPKSAQTWWSGMSEEAIIDRITSLLRYRIEVPQEVQKWIPQAQQRLNERLAV